MKKIMPLLFFYYCGFSQLRMEKKLELGSIAEAYEIKGDMIITNAGEKKIYLMRADADQGVRIYTSKKILAPSDTCLLTISFHPEKKGRFNKEIRLVSSDQGPPHRIVLSGDLQSVQKDNKMACFYFGRGRTSPVPTREFALEAPPEIQKRDISNRIPDASRRSMKPDSVPETVHVQTVATSIAENHSKELDETKYVANNLIFLVDVSGSMKDSTKLPLMKVALHALIDEIRDIDRLTFITYADTIKVLLEGGNAARRKELHATVDALKARGMTKGKKAIFFSQEIAQKNYIEKGNNQIIVATDGEFRFGKEDHRLWNEKQGSKKVILSAVAFGTDKEALKNLRELARKGDGSFIRIKDRSEAEQKILHEVQQRSRKGK